MKTIFKYPLAIADVQTLKLPHFAQPLSVQIQHREPQLWALVDTSAPVGEYEVLMYGTGHKVAELPVGHEFLGTIQWGSLVFHYFGYPKK